MNQYKTLPPDHQWMATSDGTFTLFSENFQEACHSPTGAKEETLLHYLAGCKVVEKIKHQNSLSILEVGFGLGIGFLTTYEVITPSDKPWQFLSLELDENLLEWFRIENFSHPFLKNLSWKNQDGLKILSAKNDLIELTILCGDARATLPKYAELINPQWDAIYQDAFSPKKNPTLWTVEWFKLLKEHSRQEVAMSTYSASPSVRKSMTEAGWKLHKGEKFGTKRTSTRATLTGETDPEIVLDLKRSPIDAFRDSIYKLD